MDFRRKPGLTAREFWLLVGIGAATLVIANTLIGANVFLSRSIRGGGQFLAAWAGARAVIWQQASPYASPVVELTQQLAYGRPAQAGENPFFLTIPFYLLLLYFPSALTPVSSLARGLFLALSQAALVGTVFVSVHLIGWRPPRAFTIVYSIFAVMGLYSVLALFDGSQAVMLGLLYVGALWAYGAERDELAGALLALCLFDWEAGALFILLFGLRVFEERRWNVLAGAGMVLVVLGVISFLVFPGWILPFLAAALATVRASFGVWTASGLDYIFPQQGALAAQILTLLIAILLVYEWFTGRGTDFRRFVWTACLALAASPLLGYRTELSNLVVLLPGVALICAASMQHLKYGGLMAGLFLGLVFLAPWYLFGRSLAFGDSVSRSLLLLVYPLLTILGLYWTRWWFIHSQQTWLDQVRSARIGA